MNTNYDISSINKKNNQNLFISHKKSFKNKYYCKNCGKYGHQYKKCKDPITSYGIICFRLINKNTQNLIKYNNINNFNKVKLNCISSDIDIQYLLVQRKHTLGYIEFIRGKYFISDLFSIMILFKQMVQEEINSIQNSNFDQHWNSLWIHDYSSIYIYRNEYINSKKKYTFLKENVNSKINLRYIINNIKPRFSFKEWGIPKGRRNTNETEVNCAIREFEEETSYNSSEFELFSDMINYTEIFNGTNGIKYQHIYFVSNCLTNRNPLLTINGEFQSNEIGDIKWTSYKEAMLLIRPYHTEKLEILSNINKMLTSYIHCIT